MKYLIYALIVFMMSSCQSKTSKIDKLIDVKEHQKSKSEQVDDKRTYISDSIYLNYDYQTVLKNEYSLEYRVYVESSSSDTLQTIFLMNGVRTIKELGGGHSYDLPHKNLGYVGADFNNSFAFVQSYGSGNPNYFQLIDKKTGKELRSGIWVDVNEDEQVLLYLKDENDETDKLMMYDVKNSNEIISTGFEKSICAKELVGRLRDCVEIDTVTADVIILKIHSEQEKVIKKYKR